MADSIEGLVEERAPCDGAEDLSQLVADLFEQHEAAVRAYIYSLVRNRELAHDLTQEAYLQLYQTRIRLRKVENRRAWLYRIASRVAFKEMRRRRRFAWLPWSHVDEEAHITRTVHGADPGNEVDQRLLVENALATLPADQRATLLLYSRHGLKIREIAGSLEIGESAVKMRLHRARAAFKEAYRAQLDEPEKHEDEDNYE